MLENQVKNTIKLVLAAVAVTVFGEGVFGVGLYWPFLILLLDWDGVFWLALGLGLLVSVLNGLPVGMPSLFLVLFVGIFSLIFGGRRDVPLIVVIALVFSNFLFDKLVGLSFGFGEFIVTSIFCVLVLGWGEKNESIHIKYR